MHSAENNLCDELLLERVSKKIQYFDTDALLNPPLLKGQILKVFFGFVSASCSTRSLSTAMVFNSFSFSTRHL